MALASQFSAGSTSAGLDARTARLAGGYLRIYGAGAQPATADTPLTGQTLISEHRFGTPAFAPSTVTGTTATAVANAITQGSALATIPATFFVCYRADGVTPECMGSAGRAGYATDGVTPSVGAVYNLTLANAVAQAGMDVPVASLVLTASLAGT